MGGAISAVTRVFDALCASPFATRMGDPITSPLAPEQRLIDIAQMISRAHLANRRAHVKDRARRRPRMARSDAPAASDRLAREQSVRRPAARPRRRPDARIVYGWEVSL